MSSPSRRLSRWLSKEASPGLSGSPLVASSWPPSRWIFSRPACSAFPARCPDRHGGRRTRRRGRRRRQRPATEPRSAYASTTKLTVSATIAARVAEEQGRPRAGPSRRRHQPGALPGRREQGSRPSACTRSNWRLVHDPPVEAYLGEMVHYTPGAHLLASLVGPLDRDGRVSCRLSGRRMVGRPQDRLRLSHRGADSRRSGPAEPDTRCRSAKAGHYMGVCRDRGCAAAPPASLLRRFIRAVFLHRAGRLGDVRRRDVVGARGLGRAAFDRRRSSSLPSPASACSSRGRSGLVRRSSCSHGSVSALRDFPR